MFLNSRFSLLNAGRGLHAAILPCASAGLIILGLAVGGASRIDPIGHMVVQLSGLFVLALAGWRLRSVRVAPSAWLPLAILASLALIPLLQLVALPPTVWKALPGREPLAQAAALAGLPDRWRPLSLAPEETQRGLLALIAPAGLFLAVLTADVRERAVLTMAIVAIALLALLVAAIQAAGGQAGYLHFRPEAPVGSPLGFFVNRNHQAAFMLSAAVLSAVLARVELAEGRPALRPIIALVLVGLLIAGAAATLSRAGVLLAAPALAGGLLILRPAGRDPQQAGAGRVAAWAAGLITLAALSGMVVMAKGGLLLDRFEHGETDGGRLGFLPQVVELGRAHQPVGAGIGAFDIVYRAGERLDQIDPFYLNHAHNDYLEGWLEAGVPAVLLVAAFLAWWGLAVRRHWFSANGSALGRGGTVIVGLLLAHSLVDYPLRTPAMALIFAFACALAIEPLGRRET